MEKMNRFYNQLEEKETLIIFGYADLGQRLYEEFKKRFPNKTVLVCDNAPDVRKKYVDGGGTYVYSVMEAVKEYMPGGVFIPTSLRNSSCMIQQLVKLGVPDDSIFPATEWIAYAKQWEQARRCRKRDKIAFSVDIVRHCNLNCASCSHYSPLVQEEFLDLGIFSSDLKRLSELFDGEADKIDLLGGEPLLNKKIGEYIAIARRNFPNTDIVITTNGILLRSMPDSFWKICMECNVGIMISRYPIQLDYDELYSFLEQKGVRWEINPCMVTAASVFECIPFDFEGKQNAKENFLNCLQANGCIALWKGKLYPCITAAFAYLINEYFHVNMNLSKEDGIDIYQAESGEEILSFLASPIPFCRYCNQKGRRVVPWEKSKRNIQEWS